ncbi:MAG: SusC/RagA family TonB-linked outer membrane protein [Muribaculaceae bacterium]|nr:SusC/RagA family TonB-linked outer membrane protein [Muribaculaceae bacterium]
MRKLFLIMMTLVACSWAAMAQTTYHGTVVDASTNEPLIGATIMPIGGGNGAATDIDGKYTISVPANVKRAKVSYVGYAEQTVHLTNNMTIKLVSTEQNLDDLVVVAYGTANKESLTGSVAVVGSKEIEDRPVTSVTAALEGNAPGVQVNNSVGYPGSSPSILIRGFSSVTGSSSPLYVVDGIVFEGSIADLNPADIESMSVLKDAASCALYGNRGANGVILITTKRAKKGDKVDVTLQIRQGGYTRGLPFYDRLDANQFMQTFFTGLVNGEMYKGTSRDAAIAQFQNSFFSYASANIYGKPASELFNSDGQFIGGNPLPGYTDLDWWDAVSQTGYRQEYNINAANSGEKHDLFASVGYLKENGYMICTDFERFNARVNANFQPASYFRTGLNLSANYSTNSLGITSTSSEGLVTNPFNVQTIAPIYPVYAHDPETGEILRGTNGAPLYNTSNYLGAQGANVAWTTRLDKKQAQALVVDGSMFGTAIIPYGFELTVRGSIHRDKTGSWEYNNNLNGSAETMNGRMYQRDYAVNSHTFMQTLTWNHSYGDHSIDVLLDHENYEYSEENHSIQVQDQLLPEIYSLSNFSDTQPASQSFLKLCSESYLGRARYNYNQQYFGEVSFRRDGSSYFEKGIRWGNFWSVGASWIISKEKFMQNLNWVDYLKLRAAYGSVGNDGSAGAYAYYTIYDIITYGPVNSLLPVNRASDNLKWESAKTFDIALEGSLFNDRFNFSIGYYNRRNTDLIFNVVKPLSGGSIYSSGGLGYNPTIKSNIGTMQNIGWELSFAVDILRNRDFYWNFTVDATFNKNKIVKLPLGHDEPGNSWFLGKNLYAFYGSEWAGVDMTTGQSVYEMDPSSPQFTTWDENNVPTQNLSTFQTYLANASNEGTLLVVNQPDGSQKFYTNTPSYATRKVLGDPSPVCYGSFGTNFSWKGIKLGMLFTYSLGGKVYDSNYASLMMCSSEASALHKDLLNSWVEKPAGMADHEMTEVTFNGKTYNAYVANASDFDKDAIPQLNAQRSAENNGSLSRWLTDASYLVFKNLNVSYDLPQKWVSAMKLQNINIGFSMDNVFYATKRKGMNPQYSFSGRQGNYYVPARVYTFQLTAKF